MLVLFGLVLFCYLVVFSFWFYLLFVFDFFGVCSYGLCDYLWVSCDVLVVCVV